MWMLWSQLLRGYCCEKGLETPVCLRRHDKLLLGGEETRAQYRSRETPRLSSLHRFLERTLTTLNLSLLCRGLRGLNWACIG